jgi:hypothetical protein
LSYWIVSLDKVRALKVVLSNGSNEDGKCKMATGIKQQLRCYLPADIFSVWKCLTDLEKILVFGIYTKMWEQIEVLGLYSFVLKLPEDGTTAVETRRNLILVMNCILGSEFLVDMLLAMVPFSVQ